MMLRASSAHRLCAVFLSIFQHLHGAYAEYCDTCWTNCGFDEHTPECVLMG